MASRATKKAAPLQELRTRLKQLAVDLHVLSEIHGLLRAHLASTGKLTPAEVAAWERDVMVPAMARRGFNVEPATTTTEPVLSRPAEPPAKPVVITSGYLQAVVTAGPTVGACEVNPAALLER